MKWEDISSRAAKIYRHNGNTLVVTIVFGHVNYPDEWVLQTRPQIFTRDNSPLNLPKDMGDGDVKKVAEMVVSQRLAVMLSEVTEVTHV